MSTAATGSSGIIGIAGGAFLLIWRFIGTLVSWLFAICLLPFKVLFTVMWWIVHPFVYSTSRSWKIFRELSAWFVEEFEVRLQFTSHASTLG
jgi:hypothetical protein